MDSLDLIEEQAALIESDPAFAPTGADLVIWFYSYWEAKEAEVKAALAEKSK